jgi:mannose-6-phosphate isomerase
MTFRGSRQYAAGRRDRGTLASSIFLQLTGDAEMTPQKLDTIRVEKPWGVTDLPPPFISRSDRRIGEIWFDPPPGCPLLVKYLFTSERLSIQVHPDDRQARERGLPAGKEECWYILAAEAGAQLGIGTRRPLDESELREAALSGELEELMQWHSVEAGMFFHVPAGTVHAIGAGVSLVEIQQNSDVTYRLFDYGRPRELHLADGASVAAAAPMFAGLRQTVDASASVRLLDSHHLAIAHIAAGDFSPLQEADGGMMLVPLEGEIRAGGIPARAGECLWAENGGEVDASGGTRFLAGWFKP